MVHTRHSGDVEVDSPPRFLSLDDKRSRKSRSHAADANEQDSDHSGIVYQSKDHSIFEEKVVESRLRPRTGPRRAYNYVYADSSDDEMMSRQHRSRILTEGPFKVSRHSKQHRITHEPSSDEEEDVRQERSRHWCSTTGRRRGRPLPSHKQINHHDHQKHEQRVGEGIGLDVDDEEEDDDEDDNNSALRRSSRLRQKPYRFRPANADNSEKDDNTISLEREKRRHSDPNNSHEEFDDMYSRVKRARTRKVADQRHEQSASNSDGTNDDDKNDSDDENQQQRRSYSLREHKPRTQLYIAPAIEAIKKKPKAQSLFRETPPRRVHKKAASYRSPAHRRIDFSRKRQAFHGSSSSTSSDPSDSGTETSDEQRFNRRKAKSMAKSRSRICPLNFTADMVSTPGVLKDRVKTGASLADVDPMEIDRSVTFESVGGLQKHIMALKEMVVFPLLYPEFYEHFKVAPSRGVLFYGPPGTGKTLVARALANECSRGTQKVAFFMRKGADCLSKWVGEAERQLRLLFDKAYEMRPSIIFFDEIDGLAPVRSSRQDQIHSSIVSTLLALMDGIDSRGEIVVIGATNRIDSIDPALRRPGRFDREFHFPLPNLEDRKKILKIHTRNWNPPLRDDFLIELAEKCSGYCGADVKSLVTEASQNALRRHYPQIYTTSDKLQLDISSITLTARDFAQAINTIVPAAQRAVPNPALALEESVRPLLTRPLNQLQAMLASRFPYAKLTCKEGPAVAKQGSNGSEGALQGVLDVELASDEEENMPSIFLPHVRGNKSHSVQPPSTSSFLRFSAGSSSFPVVFRPRMLVSGATGQGQSVHLAPAALHLMEHLPVHTLSSATLFAASTKMPEEACSHVFHEAMRTAPSIIYMPYINELWGVVSDSLRVTFLTLIRSMSPSTPILMMATSETTYRDLDEQLKSLFSMSGGEVIEVKSPAAEERRQYFTELILHQTVRPPPTRKQAARRVLQPLPKAAAPEPRKLTEREQRKLIEQEEDTLRELRIFLRDILSKLGREKRFFIFTKPVDIEEVPDYYDIIKNPMDLSTMMSNIDLHKYNTASAFLDDIFLICSNALEYNPDRGPTDRAIRHRACSMRDMAQALLKAELDPEFEKLCQEIEESRNRRGVDSSKSAPAFYHTRPLTSGSGPLQAGDTVTFIQPQAIPEGCRYSRRVRGLEADRTLPLEAVEKTTTVEKTLLRKNVTYSPEMGVSSAAEETSAADASTSSKHAEDGENEEEREEVEDAGDQSLKASNDANSTSPKESSDRTPDCKCPGSNDPSPSHSGKSPKGSGSDSKQQAAAKRASIRKKCPWLATRRRRRILHPTSPIRRPPSSSFRPRHPQPTSKDGHHLRGSIGVGGDRRNGPADVEERFRVEAVEARCSPSASSKRGSDGWDDGAATSHRSRREYSPVSAANPANVSARIVRGSATSGEDNTPLPTITNATTTAASGAVAAASHHEEPGSLRQRKESETSPAQGDGTTKVTRSLDVELIVTTDSGVSSESNGDSRDSLDHNNSNRTNTAGENESRLPVNGEDVVAASTSSGPSFIRTRTRTQNPLQMNALAELEVETRSVEVDKERLARLLDTTVNRTQGLTVERLQQLYSVLSCTIFSHRLHFNKMALIQEMEETLDRFCRETEECQ